MDMMNKGFLGVIWLILLVLFSDFVWLMFPVFIYIYIYEWKDMNSREKEKEKKIILFIFINKQ